LKKILERYALLIVDKEIHLFIVLLCIFVVITFLVVYSNYINFPLSPLIFLKLVILYSLISLICLINNIIVKK